MADLSSYTDIALLELLQNDDEAAFTEIYNRYWVRIFGIAYQRIQARQAAEDVVQEVFASLWQRRQAATIQSLYAYLAAATKYAVLQQLLKNGRQTIQDLDTAEIHPVADYSIDMRFLQQMIDAEINRLPEKCRLVFEYSRKDGLPNKAIAQQLNISEKAVEKHISVAIRKLRHNLKGFTMYIPFL